MVNMCQSFSPYHILFIRVLIMGLGVFGAGSLCATIATEPSSTCLSCDGEATYDTNLGGLVLYEWYDEFGILVFSEQHANGSSILSGLCPGIYSVQVTNGIQNDYEFFNINTTAVNAGEWSELITCHDSPPTNLFDQLQGNPQAGGTWTTPDGNPFTGIFDPELDQPGTYYYQLDGGGCSVTNGIDVAVNQNADPGLSTTYLICETYGPFLLTNVLAGSPDPGGQWLLPDQTPFDGIYDTDTHNSGSYFYQIDTVPGCPQVVSVLTIIENTLPNPGESNTVYICPNAPAFEMTSQLGGTPQTNGNWTNNMNQTVPAIFDPLIHPEGTYTYTVPAATPCTAQEADLTIVFTAGISAGEDADVSFCEIDEPVDLYNELGGTPTPDGLWYDPNGDILEQPLDPQNALVGAYVYEVSAVGCPTETSSVAVQIETLPNAGQDGETFICDAASPFLLDDLNSADADDGGVWTDEDQQVVQDPFEPLTNETYILTYTVQNSVCPADDAIYTVHIDQAPPTPQNNTLEICQSADAVDLAPLMIDPNGFDAFWTHLGETLEDSNFDPGADAEGVYEFTISSGNSCPDQSAELSIEVLEEVFESEYQQVNICYSEPEVDLESFFDGIDWTLGEWEHDDVAIDPVFPVNLEIGGSYYFEVENDPQCSASELELFINVVTVPDAGNDGSILWCESNETLDLTIGLNGASSNEGTWFYNGVEVNSVIEANEVNNGLYTFFLDAIGPCPADEAEIQVTFDPGIEFDLGDDLSVCANSESLELGVDQDPAYTYSWYVAGVIENNNTSAIAFAPLNSGQSPILNELVLVADNGVCVASDTLIVTVNPIPQPQIVGPQALCVGDEGSWVAEGGLGYEWTGNVIYPDPFSQAQQFVVEDVMNLSITAFNEFNCEATASLQVIPMPLPDVYFEASPLTGCAPLDATLINLSENDDPTDYVWIVNGTDSYLENAPTITLTEEGFHDVQLVATSAFGCVNSLLQEDYLQAYSIPQSSWTYAPDEITELNTTVEFEDMSTGADTYMWEFGDLDISEEANPVYHFPEIGGLGYQVCQTVWSEYGCSNQSCHDIYIDGTFSVYTPNTFTPDNDGVNETFYPVCHGFDPDDYSLRIFDRWGELVFESNDPAQSWFGNVQGQGHYAPDGVYVWQLSVRSLYKAEIQSFSGFVTLLR